MALTHEIITVPRKPTDGEISSLVVEYFNAQGATYDALEIQSTKRARYLDGVNRVVAAELIETPSISNVLSIMCGTGRRELEIQELVGRPLEFLGVEACPSMAQIAKGRGLTIHEGTLRDVSIAPAAKFDAAMVLYALGHLPSTDERILFLKGIAQYLSDGAPLFFDVFNLADRTDLWGAEIQKQFDLMNLKERGYEQGDVFYRRVDTSELAFLHYFTPDEVKFLLEQSGFKLKKMSFISYGNHAGEVTDSSESGSIFVTAARK